MAARNALRANAYGVVYRASAAVPDRTAGRGTAGEELVAVTAAQLRDVGTRLARIEATRSLAAEQ